MSQPYIEIGRELISITSINHDTGEVKGLRNKEPFLAVVDQSNIYTCPCPASTVIKFTPDGVSEVSHKR